jgi:hypothetical protein
MTLALYAGIALGLALAASTKPGAAGNYFIEPTFAAAVFAGRGLAYFAGLVRTRRSWRPLVAVLSLVLVYPPLDTFRNSPLIKRVWSSSPNPAHLDVPAAHVFRRLEEVRGDVLFGDAGLAVRSGRPVLLLDQFNCSYLADAGCLDLSELVGRLRRREIAAVLLEHPEPFHRTGSGYLWCPREIAQAVSSRYRFEGMIYGQYLYVPSGTGSDPPPRDTE